MNTDLINRSVVIFTASTTGEVDEAGDEVMSEESVETVAEIQPRTPDESTAHPDIAESDWIGYFLPADLPNLNSASTVWIPDEGEFEVLGAPHAWRDPFSQVTEYVEVALQRIAGIDDSRGS